MNKHTPTPWRIKDAGTPERMLNIDYEDGDLRSIVARLCDDDLCPEHGTLDGNAEFICRACNSHDALLAACYIALTAVDTALCGTPSSAYFSAVKTALKSASATSVEDNLAVNVKEIKEACEKAHIALHAAIALATGNESGKE